MAVGAEDLRAGSRERVSGCSEGACANVGIRPLLGLQRRRRELVVRP